jgi:hypothetical protein
MDGIIQITTKLVEYVRRYGGRCRECADASSVCPNSGLPCDDPDTAIRHVFEAYNYGVKNGFVKPPR